MVFRCDRDTFDRFEAWLLPQWRFVPPDKIGSSILIPMPTDMSEWPLLEVEHEKEPV